VEEEVNSSLSRQTSEDDTHPSPMDRFRLVRQMNTARSPAPTGMVWSLFLNRDGLTKEMSLWVNQRVNDSAA
jgi:hypothetical protein